MSLDPELPGATRGAGANCDPSAFHFSLPRLPAYVPSTAPKGTRLCPPLSLPVPTRPPFLRPAAAEADPVPVNREVQLLLDEGIPARLSSRPFPLFAPGPSPFAQGLSSFLHKAIPLFL